MNPDNRVTFVPQEIGEEASFLHQQKADGDQGADFAKRKGCAPPTAISTDELCRLVNQVPLKSPLPIIQSDEPGSAQGQSNEMIFCAVPNFCQSLLRRKKLSGGSLAGERRSLEVAESVLLLESLQVDLRTWESTRGKPPMAALFHGSSPSTLDILLGKGFHRTFPAATDSISTDTATSLSSSLQDEDPPFTFFSPNVATAAVYSNRHTFSLSAELGVPGEFTRFSVLWCGATWNEVVMLEDAPLSMEELRLMGQHSPSEVNYADAATYWLDGATCYAIPRSRVGALVTPLAVLSLVEWRNTTPPTR
jgi:hypothetical protein